MGVPLNVGKIEVLADKWMFNRDALVATWRKATANPTVDGYWSAVWAMAWVQKVLADVAKDTADGAVFGSANPATQALRERANRVAAEAAVIWNTAQTTQDPSALWLGVVVPSLYAETADIKPLDQDKPWLQEVSDLLTELAQDQVLTIASVQEATNAGQLIPNTLEGLMRWNFGGAADMVAKVFGEESVQGTGFMGRIDAALKQAGDILKTLAFAGAIGLALYLWVKK